MYQRTFSFYWKEEEINLTKEDLNKFNEIIKKDSKSDKRIISAIENILSNNRYKNNFQFIHFIKKTLGNDKGNNAKFFDKLFDKDFQEYYKFMISQINLGNYYFLNILNGLRKYYENDKITFEYRNFII